MNASSKKTRVVLGLGVCLLLGLGAFLVLRAPQAGAPSGAGEPPSKEKTAAVTPGPAAQAPRAAKPSVAPEAPAPESAAADAPEPKTEEERQAAEAEARVDAFDALTDKWMEDVKTGVTMADVAKFNAQFKQVPKDRQDECIHRALNLIPDENVMLLAGILMDKTVDKENVETVFNDILNRDEDVKKPILREIFKDKTHACWADTAWILDVTGEKPGK